MQLMGTDVTHKTFGKGTITSMSDRVVTVGFSQGEKKFVYPDAFSDFLILNDKKAQKNIEEMAQKKEEAAVAHREVLHAKHERMCRLRKLKPTPNSQAVFGLVQNEKADIFSSWNVTTGCYLSGYSKGEPRIPGRLKPNSACVVTECLPGMPEENRKVLGIFMVPDDFDGAACLDGQIQSHELYRIELEEEQQLFFWKYFEPANRPANWGKTEFKYLSGEAVQAILYDILKMAPAQQRDSIAVFYQYFCKLNQLETATLE